MVKQVMLFVSISVIQNGGVLCDSLLGGPYHARLHARSFPSRRCLHNTTCILHKPIEGPQKTLCLGGS